MARSARELSNHLWGQTFFPSPSSVLKSLSIISTVFIIGAIDQCCGSSTSGHWSIRWETGSSFGRHFNRNWMCQSCLLVVVHGTGLDEISPLWLATILEIVRISGTRNQTSKRSIPWTHGPNSTFLDVPWRIYVVADRKKMPINSVRCYRVEIKLIPMQSGMRIYLWRISKFDFRRGWYSCQKNFKRRKVGNLVTKMDWSESSDPYRYAAQGNVYWRNQLSKHVL